MKRIGQSALVHKSLAISLLDHNMTEDTFFIIIYYRLPFQLIHSGNPSRLSLAAATGLGRARATHFVIVMRMRTSIILVHRARFLACILCDAVWVGEDLCS